ncbi:class I SAM-dependent methyltransferase [Helicobacter trogontum]|uniref:class I SAM-dependent methyltransferase n=2 Tax=Helicobacter trogontum TaxID=50960 RepID=UPI000CF03DE9|nr:class I SAM-dependent methyltransferase [Helicobacter trogontum]MDY5185402.1 class I SAM-dependent methyltransferase [Helicobacter trogontum]
MKCPICLNVSQFQPIFSHHDGFVSCGRLDSVATKKLDRSYACGKATIDLMQCCECGFIFNVSFDFVSMQKEYNQNGYVSRKIVSDSMNATIQDIKNAIISHCTAMGGGGVIEIAPGSGDLAMGLTKHCEFLYTIDPSLVSLEFAKTTNHLHIHDFFNPISIKKHIRHEIHCIIFRHLLEHIDTPREFLEDVVNLIAQDGVIYVEVPNVLEFFKNARFYEVFHDHCGYYQESVLIEILNEIGCKHIDTLMFYNTQHLGLFFKKQAQQNVKKNSPVLLAPGTYAIMQNAIQKFNNTISKYMHVALYGAGAHGNSLISFLTPENKQKIICCYDLDTRKHGKYLQKSEIVITQPSKKSYSNVECIVLTAPLYEKEIIQYLREDGFSGEILTSVDCR